MAGEKICAINHTRKEFMAVGHSSLGEADLSNMKDALIVFAPRTQAGIDQFNHHNGQFGIEELLPWSKAVELNYARKKGFWDN